jgi:hypothetical protein
MALPESPENGYPAVIGGVSGRATLASLARQRGRSKTPLPQRVSGAGALSSGGSEPGPGFLSGDRDDADLDRLPISRDPGYRNRRSIITCCMNSVTNAERNLYPVLEVLCDALRKLAAA